MNILILNGPNLNLLGKREPEIYGDASFDTYYETLKEKFSDHHFEYFQSNHEGELIDRLHQADEQEDLVLLNAGGYTHTSVALGDAVRSVDVPVVEVHLSNVHSREEFRRHSMIAPGCIGVISGFGLKSYELALKAGLGVVQG